MILSLALVLATALAAYSFAQPKEGEGLTVQGLGAPSAPAQTPTPSPTPGPAATSPAPADSPSPVPAPVQELGQGVEVSVAADKAEITVGDAVAYTVTLAWKPDELDGDPLLEENLGELVIRDRGEPKREKLPDGRIRRTETFNVTSYTVGDYKLPPPVIRYTPKGASPQFAAGEPLNLKVRSIAPEDATEIRDIKPPVSVPRNLTKPVLFIAGGLVALIGLVILIVYLVRRSRNKSAAVPPEPPFDCAMRRLAAVAAISRRDHEEMKAYYVELSSILRDYLNGRFGVPAPLLTTSQLRRLIEDEGALRRGDSPSRPEDPSLLNCLFSVLDTADFVKFARFDPDENGVAEDLEAAKRFVRETRPPAPVGESGRAGQTVVPAIAPPPADAQAVAEAPPDAPPHDAPANRDAGGAP